MPGDADRFGVTTPHHAGTAVRRNRFKRLLKEFHRLNPERRDPPGALLVSLKHTDNEEGLAAEFFHLVEEARRRAARRQGGGRG